MTREKRMLEDLEAKGVKLTSQRRAVVRVFAADHTHPTAQELFERLRVEFPSMSFATVYNTLDALAAAGLSGTIRLGPAARFDPNVEPHHHAVCDRCGVVIDIPAPSLAAPASSVASVQAHAKGFSVRAVERIYRGVCGRCAGRRNREASKGE